MQRLFVGSLWHHGPAQLSNPRLKSIAWSWPQQLLYLFGWPGGRPALDGRGDDGDIEARSGPVIFLIRGGMNSGDVKAFLLQLLADFPGSRRARTLLAIVHPACTGLLEQGGHARVKLPVVLFLGKEVTRRCVESLLLPNTARYR